MLRRSLFCATLSLALLLGLRWTQRDAPAPVDAPPLRVLHEGEVVSMPLEDYLIGVVAAEMPADFAFDALKAQAVAARSYTLYCAGTNKHADADVCTDYRCCQAWRCPNELREGWGDACDARLSRIRAAVEETAGQVLRYEGRAVFAAFHSSSAGFTEDCGAIWSDTPYLVSVSSPESADSVPNYVTRLTLRPLDLRDALLSLRPEADFTGEPETWLGKIQRDRSGRVASASLGGAAFSGVKLRELFGLRSTAFALDYADGVFVFTVTGFGHGVGMSQYGANVMAAEGADYTAILAHYYPGTELDF